MLTGFFCTSKRDILYTKRFERGSPRRRIMALRSAEWFEGRDELGPQSRAVLRTLGWSREFFEGKPV
jgi:hypothetical protein